MADAETYVVAGIVAYVLYKQVFPDTHSNSQQVWQAGTNAGYDVSAADGKVYWRTSTIGGQNVTYGWMNGDFDRLNPAQKILIGLDRIIPGTWLSRLALQ